jgi:hypothetical protein
MMMMMMIMLMMMMMMMIMMMVRNGDEGVDSDGDDYVAESYEGDCRMMINDIDSEGMRLQGRDYDDYDV